MKNVLKSKTVVITGASSGIGEAMAKLYAQMGAKVVLGARSEDKLKALALQITENGGPERQQPDRHRHRYTLWL